jgi:hypothetical protein
MTLANMKYERMTVTFNGADVGCTDGPIGVSMEESTFDVTCHQNAAVVGDRIRTGLAITVSCTLKETHTSQLQEFLQYAGVSNTPSGGDEVAAFGVDKIGVGRLSDAKALKLKPVGAADDSRNFHFWKAFPIIGEVSYDSENVLMVPVTFEIYPDVTKVDEAQFGVFGDGTQDFDLV